MIIKDLMVGAKVLIVLLVCILHTGCTTDSIAEYSNENENNNNTNENNSGDTAVQDWIDEQMVDRYLYNEEYSEMTRDKSLDYDDFLYNTLWSMTTNVLDKKTYSFGSEIFSSITRIVNTKASSSHSQYGVSYGAIYPYFQELTLSQNSSLYLLSFESQYPSSPLSEAGISRSNLFYEVNGERITSSNKDALYEMILTPSLGDELQLKDLYTDEITTVTATNLYLNPVLESQIIEKDGGIKVGYMNYASFDYYFEDELLEELKAFSEAGVTDLILDLRSNLGGYVYIANELCSCIASITTDTPLIYRRYNDYMTNLYSSYTPAQLGMYYDSENEMFYDYAINDASIRTSHLTSLREKKIYCLTTFNTASASELVINALRGIDFEVVMIGSTTRGKNVGSTESYTTIDDYTYYLNPIMMQIYNAKLSSDFESGFNPDSENTLSESYPFSDYGEGEPLFDRAIELITGVSASSKTASRTSSTETAINTASNGQFYATTQQIILQPQPNRPHGAIDRGDLF